MVFKKIYYLFLIFFFSMLGLVFYFLHRPSIFLFSLLNIENIQRSKLKLQIIQDTFPSLIFGIVVMLILTFASLNFKYEYRNNVIFSVKILVISELIQLINSNIMKFDFLDLIVSFVGLLIGCLLVKLQMELIE